MSATEIPRAAYQPSTVFGRAEKHDEHGSALYLDGLRLGANEEQRQASKGMKAVPVEAVVCARASGTVSKPMQHNISIGMQETLSCRFTDGVSSEAAETTCMKKPNVKLSSRTSGGTSGKRCALLRLVKKR